MRSLARSAIIITGALMLPPARSGITEASTTRNPSTPFYTQLWVSDSKVINAHLASACRVVGRRRCGPDVRINFRFGAHLGSRTGFLEPESPH